MEALVHRFKAQCLVKSDFAATGRSWTVWMEPKGLMPAAKMLDGEGWHLEDVLAVDAAEGFLVIYHFGNFEKPGRIELRILVSHAEPKLPSLANLMQGASWHERETHDFHGIVFEGHPYPLPLLLPEDADFHPLVKEKKAALKELMYLGEPEFCAPEIAALFEGQKAPDATGEEA